jgi:hypothetical protein
LHFSLPFHQVSLPTLHSASYIRKDNTMFTIV